MARTTEPPFEALNVVVGRVSERGECKAQGKSILVACSARSRI
jgi:hypothetical protein